MKTLITLFIFSAIFIIYSCNQSAGEKVAFEKSEANSVNSDCPPEGKPNPKDIIKKDLEPREKNLNIHKNRNKSPESGDFEMSVTSEKMYNSKDDSIFSAEQATIIEGYILKGENEHGETCNCYTSDKSQYDTHVYLSLSPITKKTKISDCVIVEITPYTRTLHPEWTANTENYVNSNFKNKKVKVKGWLLYDYLHKPESIDSTPNTSKPERHTVWEIHPITDIQITN